MAAIIPGLAIWLTAVLYSATQLPQLLLPITLDLVNRGAVRYYSFEFIYYFFAPVVFLIALIPSTILVRWFLSTARSPQFDGSEPIQFEAELSVLACSVGRHTFDPDYRLRGWNQSRYAPKNRKSSIERTAFQWAWLVGATYLCLSYVLRGTQTSILPALTWAWFLWSITYLCVGTYVRRNEWRRVKRSLIATALPSHLIGMDTSTAFAFEPPTPTMSHKDFEHEVAWLINRLTGHEAVVVGGSGDGGVDIKVYDLTRRLVGIVQCKYYDPSRPLAPSAIRELYANKQRYGVNSAYLVTTARFTHASRREAQQLGIRLMDGDDLQRHRLDARTRMRQGAIRP